MPNLPYESQISASTGRTQSQVNSTVDPNAYGANVGAAMQQLGDTGLDVANKVQFVAEKKDNQQKQEQLDNLLAQDDTAKLEADLQTKTPPNGAGYKDALVIARRNAIDDKAATIDDNEVRQQYRNKAYAQLPELAARAGQWEVQAGQAYTSTQANTSLNSARNKVLNDPYAYDQAVKDSTAVITNLPNTPATLKPGMVINQQQNLTRDRFDGMILRAKTVPDYDAIAADLGKGDWQTKMNATEYQDTVNKLHTARKTFITQNNSQAEAAVNALKDRAKDPTSLIPVDDLRSAAVLVRNSTKPDLQTKMARINRDQMLVETYGPSTPAQIQLQIDMNNKSKDAALGAVPPDVAAIIDDATKYGVSATYLSSTRARESGGDGSAQNPNSSAQGSMQFVGDTFLPLIKDPSVQAALRPALDEQKIDPTKMTDEQLLALRTNDHIAIPLAAILAKQNQSYLEAHLGRGVSDTELYMAHFLGAPKATNFLQTLQTSPDANAAALFPVEAESNPKVFGVGADGKGMYSVADVYRNIAHSLVASPSSVIYGDNETLKKMKETIEKNIEGPNGLSFAATVGKIVLPPLDQPGAYPARGAALEAAQTKYGRLMKPFNTDEEAYLLKQIDDGDVNAAMSTLANIQSMGPKAATAAFEQLKVKNPAFGHAGLMALDGDVGVAGDIIRGAKRIKENPEILKGAGITEGQDSTDFYNVVGGALARMPAQVESTQKAALAYLAEGSLSSGNKYKSSDFQHAVTSVLGNRISTVHSNKVFMPKGVSGPQMDFVLQHMTPEDFMSLSVTGTAPVYADGRPVDPKTTGSEVDLHAMGGDKYTMTDASGGFLMTRRTAKSPLEQYVAELSPQQVQRLYNRNRQKYAYVPPAEWNDPDAPRQGPSRAGQDGGD